MVRIVHVAILIGAFSGMALPQFVPPTPGELIRRAIAADKTQSERNFRYTYREDHTNYQVNRDGEASSPSTHTYEHIMLEGDDYKRLIMIDGKPLDPKARKKADEEMEKVRAERKKRGPGHFSRTVAISDLDQLDRLFDNKLTGEVMVLGRRTWRVESEPKPGLKPADKQEQQVLAARHTSWFDEENGHRIKWQDVFVREANNFQPGSTIDWEMTSVGDDWLIGNTVLRVDMKFPLGIHGRIEAHQRYYDYRRFTVDSTMTPQ